jgi:PIN domain nuclease of toxin-antitoxin system
MLNLDTHILLHAVTGEVTHTEQKLLVSQEWSISAIVLWEIAKLAQLGRIEINLDDADLTRLLSRIHVWPITLDVCRAIRSLDFHSDPADELIAATSIVHHVPLITRDARIKKSKIVPLAAL